MNIKLIKLIWLLMYYCVVLSFSQTIVLFSYIIGKHNIVQILRDALFELASYMYVYGFESPIYFKGNYNATNKVDCVVVNHTSTIDFIPYITLIRQFDDRPIYIVSKKELGYVPGSGIIMLLCDDIMLDRDLDKDTDKIINKIKTIKNGIILIFPEGTRFSPDKYKKSLEYSKTNNLHIFQNTLYPKMKGLWLICNTLDELGRMGNIIDITCLVEKMYMKESSMGNMLINDFGSTYGVINTYEWLNDKLNNYEEFKKWFLNVWTIKDNIINTIISDDYIRCKPELHTSSYIILNIITSVFLYLMYHTNGLYLPISLIATYISVFNRGGGEVCLI